MAIKHWLALRLRNQYPMLQYFTGRGFGMEIEIYGLDYVTTPGDAGIIKPYNIYSKAKDGRRFRQLCLDHGIPLGADRESWHFQEDSSIMARGGVELTSPILKDLEGLVHAYHAFEFLCDIKGININQSCGFHVHHGVDPHVYTCEHIRELVKIIHPMEDYFYLLIPGDRRQAETCRPMEIDLKAFLDPHEGICNPDSCRIKELWYSVENRYDAEAARYPRYDKTRYHGLNLHSYWYRSTIEFRYHSAVLRNIDEAMQWIIFTQFLIEMSQGHIPTIYFYPGANKWLQTIYKIYLTFGYLDRIKRLSN